MPAVPISSGLVNFGSVVMLAVAALFPLVDPLGGAPIYLAMTAGLNSTDRTRMAKSVAINSFLLLAVSALIGAYVLDFFGLSIPSVQVAGGIVVCLMAWSLLNSPNTPQSVDRAAPQSATPEYLSQRAFYPMTMPLTVGPGSITVALTLGANPPSGFRQLLLTALAHGVGIFLVALGVYLCYRYADRILRKLGATGTSVVVRLTAFILLCVGVQICWNGIHALIAGGCPPQTSFAVPIAPSTSRSAAVVGSPGGRRERSDPRKSSYQPQPLGLGRVLWSMPLCSADDGQFLKSRSDRGRWPCDARRTYGIKVG
jgi:multiple antibiotic resistance protein